MSRTRKKRSKAYRITRGALLSIAASVAAVVAGAVVIGNRAQRAPQPKTAPADQD